MALFPVVMLSVVLFRLIDDGLVVKKVRKGKKGSWCGSTTVFRWLIVKSLSSSTIISKKQNMSVKSS